MKIDFNKKKIWGLIIFVVICLTVIVISIINKKDLLKLKKESINVEYGQSVSIDLNDYLDLSDLSNKEKKDVLKNTKYKSNVKNELETITNQDGTISQKDRGFAKIGDYKITLTYQNEVETIKVKVRDTVTPRLSGPDNIEIIQGTDLTTFDFKSLISATDLSQLNDVIIDYSAIDTNILGEYKVKASVEDVNKNKAEKEFKVTVVVAPLVIEQESTTNLQTNTITNKKEALIIQIEVRIILTHQVVVQVIKEILIQEVLKIMEILMEVIQEIPGNHQVEKLNLKNLIHQN